MYDHVMYEYRVIYIKKLHIICTKWTISYAQNFAIVSQAYTWRSCYVQHSVSISDFLNILTINCLCFYSTSFTEQWLLLCTKCWALFSCSPCRYRRIVSGCAERLLEHPLSGSQWLTLRSNFAQVVRTQSLLLNQRNSIAQYQLHNSDPLTC